MAVIIKKKQTHTDLASYLHAACFSPVRSTFASAISKNFFKTWPGLTPELIRKHLPPVIATTQGHLHQERQHLQSTKMNKDDDQTKIDKLSERLKALTLKNKKSEENGYITNHNSLNNEKNEENRYITSHNSLNNEKMII